MAAGYQLTHRLRPAGLATNSRDRVLCLNYIMSNRARRCGELYYDLRSSRRNR